MTLQKTLRYLLLTGIFATLFIPFLVVSDLYFPFITAKAYAFRIIVEILFFAWIALAFIDPAYRPKKSLLALGMTVLVVITFISNKQGLDFMNSFWSNYERMDGYVTLLHVFALFLVVSSVLNTEKLWTYFWNTSIVLSLGHIFYALLQIGGLVTLSAGGSRVDGTFGNPIYLAVFMLFHVFITLFYLLRHAPATWVRWFYIVTIVLQVVTIFLTATRGTILGLLGGLSVMFILLAVFSKNKPLKVAGVTYVAVAVVFAGIILGAKDSTFVQSVPAFKRLASISIEDNTTFARFVNWGIAIDAFKERPLLGYGQENYDTIFDSRYDPRIWDQEQWFDRTHNIVFDWLVSGGILGLLAYLSLFAATLWYLWKKGSDFSVIEKSVLTGFLAAYFFHNLFVFDNLTSYMLFMFVLGYVHYRVGGAPLFAEKKPYIPSAQTAGIVVAVLLIAAPITAWGLNASNLRQNMLMMDAFTEVRKGDVVSAQALFQESLEEDTFGNTEVRQQLMIIAGSIIRSDLPNEVKTSFATFTLQEMLQELEAHPNDARFYFMAGQFTASIGDYNKALEYLYHAESLSPKKQLIKRPIIEILLLQGKSEEALQLAKETYEIETANDIAWQQYLLAAKRVGNEDLYAALISEAYDTGRADRVISLLQNDVANNPDNVQAYASLATAYYVAGQKDEAINIFKLMIEKFPEAAGQAQQVIDQINAGVDITVQ